MLKFYIFIKLNLLVMKKINWQYTFGEILIVIIGISIAFSLNKCSENNQNKKIQKLYLENLKDDIETDKTNLESNLEKLNAKDKVLANTYKYYSPLSPKRDSVLFYSFLKSVQVIEFSPKNTTHLTLMNSGDLKLIDNFELRTDIQEHYRKYGSLQLNYERMENISKKYVADYFIYNIDMGKLRTGEKAYNDEKLLKSIMQSMHGALGLKISSTQESIKSCENIIEKINIELK